MAGKRITDQPLVPEVVDNIKIPTGEVGDLTISVGQLKSHIQEEMSDTGLKVADWDASGAALPLDPAAIGGTLATIDGIATVAPLDPVPVLAGEASFYGLTMPIGLPAASAALDMNWPLLPTDVPSYVFALLHDQSADLSALVEAVFSEGAAGVSGLLAGAESGNGFGLTFPNNDEFPLTLPEFGSSILLTVKSDGSLVFGGFGDDILTDSAAANGYAISYLMVVVGVSESLPPLSVNIGTSDLSGGYSAAELPDNVSDLDTIYRVTNGGTYAGQTLNQNDHVIFYNQAADFITIRLPTDTIELPDFLTESDVLTLIDTAILNSVENQGVVDNAINLKLTRSLIPPNGLINNFIVSKLNPVVRDSYVAAKLVRQYASEQFVGGLGAQGIYWLNFENGVTIANIYYPKDSFVYYNGTFTNGAYNLQNVFFDQDLTLDVIQAGSSRKRKLAFNQATYEWAFTDVYITKSLTTSSDTVFINSLNNYVDVFNSNITKLHIFSQFNEVVKVYVKSDTSKTLELILDNPFGQSIGTITSGTALDGTTLTINSNEIILLEYFSPFTKTGYYTEEFLEFSTLKATTFLR